MGKGSSKQRDVIEYETTTDEGFTKTLRKDLQVLIAYASGADVVLQREVAERLANEAVKAERQAQIVELGGLKLLLPLTRSSDTEVQRLAAHALANLSVSTDNQVKLANQGGVEMLISLLPSDNQQDHG